MGKSKIVVAVFVFLLALVTVKLLTSQFTNPEKELDNQASQLQENLQEVVVNDSGKKLMVLKDVGEPFMDFFGLSDNDFRLISSAGFNLIESTFDICATDEDVAYFLNKANEYGLQIIMTAGAGEAEWGYSCDEVALADQKPVWQKEAVKNWVNKWKGNKAIYAWDISNEAGSVFPNADNRYYLTADQLKEAYQTVKEADPTRPVIIRMNGWFFYDYESNFFRAGNPFTTDVADIVMINAYSNVEDYFDDFVFTVTQRAINSIGEIDSDIKLIISLGVWEEKPLWFRPTAAQIKNDYNSLKNFDILGVAYFKYGAKNSEWYLPDYKTIWDELQKLNLETN